MTSDYRKQVPSIQNDQKYFISQMKDRYDTVTGNDITDYAFDCIKRAIADHPDEVGFAFSIGVTAFWIVESILYGRRVFNH